MKLLYATNNNSKVYNMKRRLKGLPIEIITPRELEISLKVVEDGTTPTENAIKKAQAYFDYTNIPTIAGDSGLHIVKLSDDEQPGLHVRRVNGRELTDDEMIEYYAQRMAELGGESEAYYITGIALITNDGLKTVEIEETPFILTSEVDKENTHRGNPLDVITIDPICHKYYSSMTDDDVKDRGFNFDKELVRFIEENLL